MVLVIEWIERAKKKGKYIVDLKLDLSKGDVQRWTEIWTCEKLYKHCDDYLTALATKVKKAYIEFSQDAEDIMLELLDKDCKWINSTRRSEH